VIKGNPRDDRNLCDLCGQEFAAGGGEGTTLGNEISIYDLCAECMGAADVCPTNHFYEARIGQSSRVDPDGSRLADLFRRLDASRRERFGQWERHERKAA
jgi:ferredoxin